MYVLLSVPLACTHQFHILDTLLVNLNVVVLLVPTNLTVLMLLGMEDIVV